jgi:sialic acid synthase SpsE
MVGIVEFTEFGNVTCPILPLTTMAKALLELHGFKRMIKTIRNVEKILENGIKNRQKKKEFKKLPGKSIVAKINIPESILIVKSMLTLKMFNIGILYNFFKMR